MIIVDTVTLDGVRRTADGYIAATARVARTGIQIYGGAEVGRPDLAQVRVYRPEAEVFKADTLRSFAHRPVTVDHPQEPVTAENWRKFAVGHTGDEVARDGDFIRVPLALMDADAIKAVDGGKRELSMGYTTDLKWESGVTPSGEAYDAIQTAIRANHLAVVAAARGGSQLRIGDDQEKKEFTMSTQKITIDGITVEMSDTAAQVVAKLQTNLTDASKALADANAKITALTADVSTRDGEIAVLKKQVNDAKLTPAQLDAAVAARLAVIADAKAIGGDKLVTDGKTEAEIRRAVVAAKLGDDAAKSMDDAAIGGAFAALAKVKPAGGDQFRTAAREGFQSQDSADVKRQSDEAWSKNVADMNAWRKTA